MIFIVEKDEYSMSEHKIWRDRLIIARIYDLLPTVQEALQQVSSSVECLDFDTARSLFENAIVAIKKIGENLLLINIDIGKRFLPLMKKLRLLISSVTMLWEKDRLIDGQTILNDALIPCYDQWNKFIVKFLSSKRFRYLQN